MLRAIFVVVLVSCALAAVGQKKKRERQKEPVILFRINEREIPADEFVYLYNKNHQSKPDEYTASDINEYLNLFVKFKLKVEEARQRGMDTTSDFLSEYNTYRNELIKPHLPDNRILDSLVAQAYERMKEEVRASHLLISVRTDAAPEDTLAAFNKITMLKTRALNGEDFGTLAMEFSDDPSAKSNQGDLGYFTALQMVYPFETAAYQTKVGDLAGPVRTQFGYHLIKVIDRQPARGEVEVSHIMLRADKTNEQALQDRAFNIHEQLLAGASWDELCRENSDDANSRARGGRLPAFGVGAMASVPEFEKVAFSLRAGDISDPFQTAYGWHILRVERKIPLPTFDELKPELKNKVAADQRFDNSRALWVRSLKDELGYLENASVKQQLMDMADSVIPGNMWKEGVLTDMKSQPLFSLKDQGFTVGDFDAYAGRRQIQRRGNPAELVEKLFDQFAEEKLLDALGEKLMARNPEFRMLANEYYEGILLFEIMEKEVWNKAAEDTAGQADYFRRHQSDYQAGERARATIFSSPDSLVMRELKRLAETENLDGLTKYAENQNIRSEMGVFGRDDRDILQKVAWSPGAHSAENRGMYYLAWIYQILPPGGKSLEEARASVIADYQQELENAWVRELEKKYPVKIDGKAMQYVLDLLQKR